MRDDIAESLRGGLLFLLALYVVCVYMHVVSKKINEEELQELFPEGV